MFIVLICMAAVSLYDFLLESGKVPYRGGLERFGGFVSWLALIGMPLGLILGVRAWRTWQARFALLCGVAATVYYVNWMLKYLWIFDIHAGR